MMPKFTAFARFRSSRVSVSAGLPSTSAAVDPVDVLAAREGVLERRLLGEVGEDPKLHLRVVGREQRVALAGDERASDLAPERRPDGDVLEVGADRRQPARGRGGLAERRVQAPVGRDRSGQGAAGDTCSGASTAPATARRRRRWGAARGSWRARARRWSSRSCPCGRRAGRAARRAPRRAAWATRSRTALRPARGSAPRAPPPDRPASRRSRPGGRCRRGCPTASIAPSTGISGSSMLS